MPESKPPLPLCPKCGCVLEHRFKGTNGTVVHELRCVAATLCGYATPLCRTLTDAKQYVEKRKTATEKRRRNNVQPTNPT